MIGTLHADVSPSFFGQKYEWGEPHDQKKEGNGGIALCDVRLQNDEKTGDSEQ